MRNKKQKLITERRLLLKILAADYPNSIDGLVIRTAMADFGCAISGDTFRAHVAYLSEKGLVKVNRYEGFDDIRVYALTAKGYDEMTGISKTAGVGV